MAGDENTTKDSHVIVTTGFNSVADGIDNDHNKGAEHTNGDYVMPKETIAGARAAAHLFASRAKAQNIDLSQSAEWRDAIQLDSSGGTKEISEDALAALMLARSMGSNTLMTQDADGGNTTITSTFDNSLRGNLSKPTEDLFHGILEKNDYSADRRLVLEMAKAIAVQNKLHNTIPVDEGTPQSFVQHVVSGRERGDIDIVTIAPKSR